MGIETGIAWTDSTWNPWWGCTKVSPGCANCYAEGVAARTGHDVWGAGKPRRTFGQKHWNEPLRWERDAMATGVRRKVFCASMADVCDPEAPAGAVDRLWALVRDTPHLDWQILTKRPERFTEILPADWGHGWANVWLGTTVEDQARADARIPHLLAIPAAVRFLSCEPLLEAVDLGPWTRTEHPVTDPDLDAPDGTILDGHERVGDTWVRRDGIDWIIIGGESGPRARPMDPAWVKRIVRQGRSCGAAIFVKQMGTRWADAMVAAGNHPVDRRAAADMADFPDHLRIRALPKPRRT